jgi:hypothetical protein
MTLSLDQRIENANNSILLNMANINLGVLSFNLESKSLPYVFGSGTWGGRTRLVLCPDGRV